MRTQLPSPEPVTPAEINTEYRLRYHGKRKAKTTDNKRIVFNHRRDWVTVERTTVELAEHSVRIRFPSKPSDEQRKYLWQVGGFRWSHAGFWYHKLSDVNVVFAKRLEAEGFPKM